MPSSSAMRLISFIQQFRYENMPLIHDPGLKLPVLIAVFLRSGYCLASASLYAEQKPSNEISKQIE